MMNISDDLARLNYERYQSFSDNHETENARPAAMVFNGDVYRGLEADTLDGEDWAFATGQLRILSGLYGLLRPLDLIQPYRLEMGCDFKVTAAKNTLYKFWGSRISEALNEELAGHTHPTLINLASNEYFKAVDVKTLRHPIVQIDFKEERNGQLKVISFNAKRARGLMARFMIRERIINPQHLQAFDMENYQFNQEISSPNHWVFTR